MRKPWYMRPYKGPFRLFLVAVVIKFWPVMPRSCKAWAFMNDDMPDA